jgi:hypothetical protein
MATPRLEREDSAIRIIDGEGFTMVIRKEETHHSEIEKVHVLKGWWF